MGVRLSDEELEQLSRLLNAFMDGDPDEQLSVRAYRERWDGLWAFLLWRLIDHRFAKLGDRRHCHRKWTEAQRPKLGEGEAQPLGSDLPARLRPMGGL